MNVEDDDIHVASTAFVSRGQEGFPFGAGVEEWGLPNFPRQRQVDSTCRPTKQVEDCPAQVLRVLMDNLRFRKRTSRAPIERSFLSSEPGQPERGLQ